MLTSQKILYDECKSPAQMIGGDQDHLHLLIALSRTHSIAHIVEMIKKRSSKWIKTKGDEFVDFNWQIGYGAFSVSMSDKDAVINYIAKQKEHHRTHRYQEEFRAFLDLHHIEYDERYVWD